MAYSNSYEKLYENMKNKFTIVKNNKEYTLGEYMTMKIDVAQKTAKNDEKSNAKHTVSSFLSYISTKITERKERGPQAFPVRSLASACLSLFVVCALVFSFSAISVPNDDAAISVNIEDGEQDDNKQTLEYDINK